MSTIAAFAIGAFTPLLIFRSSANEIRYYSNYVGTDDGLSSDLSPIGNQFSSFIQPMMVIGLAAVIISMYGDRYTIRDARLTNGINKATYLIGSLFLGVISVMMIRYKITDGNTIELTPASLIFIIGTVGFILSPMLRRLDEPTIKPAATSPKIEMSE